MRLAIMQPYIFPYIGYYHLICSVDKIVMYDDVNFIKQGWINRNRILVNGKPLLFTIPLKDASSFRSIKNTLINREIYHQWEKKFLSTLTLAYREAPFFDRVFELIETVLGRNHLSIADIARESLKATAAFLGIPTKFIDSSGVYQNQCLKGQERVLDICLKEGASIYNNAEGGKALYSKKIFNSCNIELQFIIPSLENYNQNTETFTAGLSIIDVMMFNNVEKIKEMLGNYRIEKP